jgi:hypothetical protein
MIRLSVFIGALDWDRVWSYKWWRRILAVPKNEGFPRFLALWRTNTETICRPHRWRYESRIARYYHSRMSTLVARTVYLYRGITFHRTALTTAYHVILGVQCASYDNIALILLYACTISSSAPDIVVGRINNRWNKNLNSIMIMIITIIIQIKFNNPPASPIYYNQTFWADSTASSISNSLLLLIVFS